MPGEVPPSPVPTDTGIGVPTEQRLPRTLAPQEIPGTMAEVLGAPSGVGLGQARADIELARRAARGDIAAGREGALGRFGQAQGLLAQAQEAGLERLMPYSTAGQGAIQQEAALSGALGPQAQQEAIDAFIESPGQQFLRERQEQALLRGSAALGGLGGGRVRSALQEQAMGIAATQQQQQLENLRSLAGRGQQAAGMGTGLIADIAGQRAGISGMEAGTIQQAAMQQAALEQQLGLARGTLAERAGYELAGIEQGLGAGQVGMELGLGQALAGVRGGTQQQLAGLTQQLGAQELGTARDVGTLLANLATQQGTQLGGLQAQIGQTQAMGQLMQGQAMQGLVSGLGQAAMYGMGQSGYGGNAPFPGGQSTGSAFGAWR